MREECFVTEETAGDRIDKFLAEQYEDLSRSFLQKLLKSGEVMVNGRPVKASYKVAEGDTISFEVPEAVEPEIVPEDIPLDMRFLSGCPAFHPDGRSRHGKKIDRECVCDDTPVRKRRK